MRLPLSTIESWTVVRGYPTNPPDRDVDRILVLDLKKGFALREVFLCVDDNKPDEFWIEERIRPNTVRTASDGGETIKIFGCYGIGSGGTLWWVSFPNDHRIRSQQGMSEQEIVEKYPYLFVESEKK